MKLPKLHAALIEARRLAMRNRFRRDRWFVQMVDELIEIVETGPENSGEEMYPPTNGTLDAMGARVAPA